MQDFYNQFFNMTTTQTPINEIAEAQSKSKRKRSTRRAKPPQIGMKLTVGQISLSEALAFVKAVVPSKPLHPVLANVLVVAEQETQQLTLTTSDMAINLSARIEATVEHAGAIALPAEVLSAVVSKCPVGYLTLESMESGNKLTATLQDRQGGTTEIRGMSAEEFPEILHVQSSPVSLPAKVVQVGLKGVLFAVSTDESKRILTGIEWQLNAGTLCCTATDGHQVAFVNLETDGIGRRKRKQRSELISSLVVPSRAIKELARTVDKVEAETQLQIAVDRVEENAAKRVQFTIAASGISKQIVCQCLEEVYPDCLALLDRYEFDTTITINRYALMTRLERLSALTDKKAKGVKFTFNHEAQKIELLIEREYGKGKQIMDTEVPEELEGFEIRFNLQYLMNILKAMSSSALKLVMSKPHTPAKVESTGDFEIPELDMTATYFLMPMCNLDEVGDVQSNAS
ncbi:DNA polymerase III subunit beta [Leptolyngbya boryana]|uniref:DNA polymerase III subunit beta n=2 Tax=Leptolyngbya TaxID=47251 RepID=UPI003297B65D